MTKSTPDVADDTISKVWGLPPEVTRLNLVGFVGTIVVLRAAAKYGVNPLIWLTIAAIVLIVIVSSLPSLRAFLDRPLFRALNTPAAPTRSAETSNTDAWYIRVEGSSLGPLTAAALRQGLLSGQFYPGALVRPHSSKEWLPVQDWPEVRQAQSRMSTVETKQSGGVDS